MCFNLFSKAKIPSKLPSEMQEFANSLKKSRSKEVVLREVYNFISNRYRGYRGLTYLRFFELFDLNLNRIWSKPGFLHCPKINLLIRILLIKSKMFKEDDIKLKWSFVWYISPHQYLQIKISKNKTINVDLWGKPYGVKFGDYCHGFNS